MKKLIFSPGMTADELIDWNVYLGQITAAEAAELRQRAAMANSRRLDDTDKR